MRFTKTGIKEFKNSLIDDGYIVYLPSQERPKKRHYSIVANYVNTYGMRCSFIVDNRYRNIYVDIDYIGLFK